MLFPTIDFALFFVGSLGLVWSLNQHNLIKKCVLLDLLIASCGMMPNCQAQDVSIFVQLPCRCCLLSSSKRFCRHW